MTQQPDSDDRSDRQGDCDRCGATVYRFRGDGDISCGSCNAIYNSAGQRLRDDLYSRINPSDYDDDIGDLEGFEMAHARSEW
jgi:hypothetical protein